MTFSVQFKNQSGEMVDITKYAVFPFSFANLLDERLDEANLTLVEDVTPIYMPTTEFVITLNDGIETKSVNLIVARDTPIKNRFSGRYKHKIYLIERTKLTEGIVCSSICFTNVKPRNYTDAAYIIEPDLEKISEPDPGKITGEVLEKFAQLNTVIKSPIGRGGPYTPPSAKTVGEWLAEAIIAVTPNTECEVVRGSDGAGGAVTKVTATDGVTTETAEWENTLTFTPSVSAPDLILEYQISLQYPNVYQEVYTAVYTLALVDNYYPSKKWTITDCVNRCLELAEPLVEGQNPLYRFDGVTYTDGVAGAYAEGSQAEEYDKIIVPEFTLTQNTLREQLKVIGSYIHAEPRLTPENTIIFEKYSVNKQSAIASKPDIGYSGSVSINEYCTEVRSNVQNLVSALGYADGVVYDPSSRWYRSVRSETVNARLSESNAIAQTAFPIYEIISVKCGIINNDYLSGTSSDYYYIAPLDITPFVFESTIYNAHLSNYDGEYPRSKQYALYYTQGQKNIEGLFFRITDSADTSTFSKFAIANILGKLQNGLTSIDIQTRLASDPENLVFNIVYRPIYNALTTHGKSVYISGRTPFAQIYNQSENLVESRYFGENIKGVVARLGNVEIERTYMLSSLSEIPKTGEMIGDYTIAAVSVEFQPYAIKCTVGLSKDFNRISQYVGVNSVKRMYEISERQVIDRTTLIHNTIVIGTKPQNYTQYQKAVFKQITGVADVFKASSVRSGATPLTVVAAYGQNKSKTIRYETVALPTIPTALGNTMIFGFSYKDNYSAGEATQYVQGDNNVNGRWLRDVQYTDYYGRLYWLSFNIFDSVFNQSLDMLPFELPEVYPAIVADSNRPINSAAHPLRLRKDNRETISVSVVVEFKTEAETMIIGSALARLCRYVSNEAFGTVELYLITDEDELPTKLDRQWRGSGTKIETPITVTENSAVDAPNFVISCGDVVSGDVVSGVGWVICTPSNIVTETVDDEDGNTVEQSVEMGREIILASLAPIDNAAIIPPLDFYIINE